MASRVIALIVAAGSGTRLGQETPKQYLELAGTSLLRRSLAPFLGHGGISAVRVVIHPSHRALYEQTVAGLALPPPIPGGETRQDSVRLGLEALANETPDAVLIHDAARPFVSEALITRVLAALERHPAVLPVVAVKDTVKRIAGGKVTATLERAELALAQTPQGFHYAPLLAAHRSAAGGSFTDDAAIAEHAGLMVATVEGEEHNFKVTSPEDWQRGEHMLAPVFPSPRAGEGQGGGNFWDGTPTVNRAKTLRSTRTEAEKKLWNCLRRGQLGGYKFRKQVPIENYVADFACMERKLVIELDGGQHALQTAYDKKRSAALEHLGFRVLRFWSNEVFENLEGVKETIIRTLSPYPHPNLPPQGGREDTHKGQQDMTYSAALRETRTGMGFDVHRFAERAATCVRICGVDVPHPLALEGHSDADVGLHAAVDALLGAVAAGDIGTHFPPSDNRWKNADSAIFLQEAGRQVAAAGGRILHLDVTLICEAPRIGPYRAAMQNRIAELLAISAARVSIKATTTEGLGFTGRKEGIAAQAVATVEIPAPHE